MIRTDRRRAEKQREIAEVPSSQKCLRPVSRWQTRAMSLLLRITCLEMEKPASTQRGSVSGTDSVVQMRRCYFDGDTDAVLCRLSSSSIFESANERPQILLLVVACLQKRFTKHAAPYPRRWDDDVVESAEKAKGRVRLVLARACMTCHPLHFKVPLLTHTTPYTHTTAGICIVASTAFELASPSVL